VIIVQQEYSYCLLLIKLKKSFIIYVKIIKLSLVYKNKKV